MKLGKIVAAILAEQMRHGDGVNKKAVSAKVWTKIEKHGGPTTIGIGRAAITLGCLYYIGNEIHRQLKANVMESEVRSLSKDGIPKELGKMLGRIPRWLAVSEGADAVWVHWSKATAQEWEENAKLKRKIANRTLAAAHQSIEIAAFLKSHGIKTLGQILEDKGGGGGEAIAA